DASEAASGARSERSGPASRLPTLQELLAAQVARTPDAPALAFAGGELSYGELDARANRLARHLHALGPGPESLVRVLLDRSAEMAVAILAILKAGAAYLPLDPTYPRERLAFMVLDSGVAVILTREELAAGLPAGPARVIALDREWPRIAARSPLPLPCPA